MKIVVFDLDETLGYFTEFGMFWDSLAHYIKIKAHTLLTQDDFNDTLDLFPEFLRPNIINILNYLKIKKESTCCHKMMIYTNNNGPREWTQHIVNYFDKKLDYNLIDQIIAAFKVNGKQIEICRTTHNKTYQDFIRCTKLPTNAEICFLDDTFHPGMSNEQIYYINVKPYYHDIPFEEMMTRFINSEIGKRVIHDSDFEIIMSNFFKSYKYKCLDKDSKEYEVDKIVGKQIITHLQTFFNDKKKKSRTMKIFRKNSKLSKKKNKTYKSI
jgi:hypothetical protein